MPWDTNIEVAADGGLEQAKVLELHRALERLAHEHASLAQVVEMHYFGGMTAEEAAEVAGRSAHTNPARPAVRPGMAAPRTHVERPRPRRVLA